MPLPPSWSECVLTHEKPPIPSSSWVGAAAMVQVVGGHGRPPRVSVGPFKTWHCGWKSSVHLCLFKYIERAACGGLPGQAEAVYSCIAGCPAPAEGVSALLQQAAAVGAGLRARLTKPGACGGHHGLGVDILRRCLAGGEPPRMMRL